VTKEKGILSRFPNSYKDTMEILNILPSIITENRPGASYKNAKPESSVPKYRSLPYNYNKLFSFHFFENHFVKPAVPMPPAAMTLQFSKNNTGEGNLCLPRMK
jgi:hypothetical protein